VLGDAQYRRLSNHIKLASGSMKRRMSQAEASRSARRVCGCQELEVVAPRLGQAAGSWEQSGNIPFSYLAFRIAQRLRSLLLYWRTKKNPAR